MNRSSIRRPTFGVIVFFASLISIEVRAQRVQWEVIDGGNGHYYEPIASSVTWSEANAAAVQAGGHLATVQSAAENEFVFQLVNADRYWKDFGESTANWGPWLGGRQEISAPEPAGGWNWVTGESLSFTKWIGGEPNNQQLQSGLQENSLHFFSSPSGTRGSHWNDFFDDPVYRLNGYVIEYEEPRKHLVLITHGYNSDSEWPSDIRNNITAQINNRFSENVAWPLSWSEHGSTYAHAPDGFNWEVVSFDWSSSAFNLTELQLIPHQAKANAERIGRRLGNMLRDEEYDSIHLIGHSAGTWLIDAIADELQSDSVDVHLTFLDAFTPGSTSLQLGDHADWAEHYVHNGSLPLTNDTLRHAFNVDVTALRPEVHPGELFEGHAFPWQWYLSSTATPTAPFNHGWGFQRSVDFQEKHPSHSIYRKGARIELVSGRVIDFKPGALSVSTQNLSINSSSTTVSDTGTISDLSSTAFTMNTGSPVWLTTEFELLEDAEFMRFSYEFLTESDGLLLVSVNGNLISLFDEGASLGVNDSDWQWMGGVLEAGTHDIRFELTGGSAVQSSVRVSNIQMGQFDLAPGPNYNNDNRIDELDYSVWRSTFGSDSDLRADGNGDSIVNAADYVTWRDNKGRVDDATLLTVSSARDVASGTTVRVAATVISTFDLVNSTNSQDFFVQDSTGGLRIFGSTNRIQSLIAGLSEGDSIIITGVTNSFNGALQLIESDDAVTIEVKGHSGLPDPVLITTDDLANFSSTAEALEGMLVKLENVQFVDTGFFLGPANYSVTDGLSLSTTRISTSQLDLVGTQIPSGLVDLIGILHQNDQTNLGPGNPGTGYQLLLRSLADISPASLETSEELDGSHSVPEPHINAFIGIACVAFLCFPKRKLSSGRNESSLRTLSQEAQVG